MLQRARNTIASLPRTRDGDRRKLLLPIVEGTFGRTAGLFPWRSFRAKRSSESLRARCQPATLRTALRTTCLRFRPLDTRLPSIPIPWRDLPKVRPQRLHMPQLSSSHAKLRHNKLGPVLRSQTCKTGSPTPTHAPGASCTDGAAAATASQWPSAVSPATGRLRLPGPAPSTAADEHAYVIATAAPAPGTEWL